MAKYRYAATRQFEKDVKLCVRQGKSMALLQDVINLLLEDGKLPSEYHPHKLSGRLDGIWECHIQSDWLLLWTRYDDELIMVMTRTGTHSEVFG